MLCSVAQCCPTLCDPMNCSPPGSSVHGILQERIVEWVAMPFSRGPSQSKEQTSTSCFSWIADRFFYQLSHQGRPRILEWVVYPFSRGSSWSRNQIGISCIAGGFFTSLATREAHICIYIYTDTSMWNSPIERSEFTILVLIIKRAFVSVWCCQMKVNSKMKEVQSQFNVFAASLRTYLCAINSGGLKLAFWIDKFIEQAINFPFTSLWCKEPKLLCIYHVTSPFSFVT